MCLRTWTAPLLAFRKNLGSTLGGNAENDLKTWTAEVLAEVKRRNAANGTILTIPPTDLDSVLRKRDRADLAARHRLLAITTADKAAGNFVYMCKSHYVQLVTDELEGSDAYTKAVGTTPETILEDGKEACRKAGLTPQVKSSIPNYHLRVKLHKNPIGFRCVAGSPHAPFTPISKAINTILKTLTCKVKGIWDALALTVPNVTPEHLAGRTGLIIDNTAKAAKFAMSFQRPRSKRHHAKLALSTWDFSNMYTTLPHEDMIERISKLLTEIFNQNDGTIPDGDDAMLCIDQVGEHTWRPKNNVGQLPKKTQTFTLQQCTDMIDELVHNTYVNFAGEMWQQTVGIPMGTNAGGMLANMYCFTYEREFLERLLRDGKMDDAFNFVTKCIRYIDDILTIDFAGFEHIIYKGRNGEDGIYPQEFLKLEPTGAGTDLDYMDLFIKQTDKLGFQTSIHDRRLSPQFKRLNIIRYPHLKSVLMDNAKYGIVTSQMTRCRDLCSSPRLFTFQSALIMYRMIQEKGYSQRKVLQRMRNFLLHGTRNKYPRHSHTLLTTMIGRWYKLLVSGRIVPGACGWEDATLPA
jgi:hypothetical protein